MERDLFKIAPRSDIAALAAAFAAEGRVQIPAVLTLESAQELREVLARGTDWGITFQGKDQPAPRSFRAAELRDAAGRAEIGRMAQSAHSSSACGGFGFAFAQFPLVTAVKERWENAEVHALLLEHLNSADFLELMRAVTGIETLTRADGQATLFAAQHYLGYHIDSHVADGWRVAYVLHLTHGPWHPDWGGYLAFYDEAGDIERAWQPRFNTLNLFRVPQPHAVTFVPPYAPVGRYAVTGWLRDR